MKKVAWLSPLLFLAACSKAPEPAGKLLFEADGCMSCHRIGPVGGVAGPDLNYVGFRHTRAWIERWLADPQAWKPSTKMPDFALKPAALAALSDYLSTLRGQEFGAEGPPWRQPALATDPVRLGAVIFLRAGCVACHGAGGKGGQPNNNVPGGQIPALNAIVATYTPEELRNKIRFGSTPTPLDPSRPPPMVSMPAWGQVLTDAEISDVADYLMSLAPKGAKQETW